MRSAIIAGAIVATSMASEKLSAQQSAEDATKFSVSQRFSFGADFLTAHPRGELKQNAGTGFGFGGHVLAGVDPWGIAGLRLDLGYLNYGNETNRYPCGQFCYYEATTTNNIINLQIGGQLAMPRNLVIPYIGASYGALWFTSTSRVETDSDQPSPFRHDVESGDATGSFMFAGGFYIPIGGAFKGLVANVGGRLFTGGYARYLTPKSLVQNPDGSYDITSYSSDTEFLVVHVGVSSSMGGRK